MDGMGAFPSLTDRQPSVGIIGGGALPTRCNTGGAALLETGGGPALAPAVLADASAGSRDLDLSLITLLELDCPRAL